MSKRKLCTFFAFVFSVSVLLGQDLIIKKDSTKLFCKILSEDSLQITYIKSSDKKRVSQAINKSDILKYYRNSGDLSAYRYKEPPEPESERSKQRRIAHELLPKKIFDTLRLEKGDTVYLKNNGTLVFRQKLITIYNLVDLMSHNSLASYHIKKAKSLFEGLFFISFITAPLVIIPLQAEGVSLRDKLLVSASIGAVAIIIDVPLNISYKHHLKKAIQLFNKEYR